MIDLLAVVLPVWAAHAVAALLSIGLSYVVALVVRRMLAHRLLALARRTQGRWDDAVVAAVTRRIPFWGLLIGLYLASGFWTLPTQAANVFNKALFVLAAGSATALAAQVAAALAGEYGHRVADDLPMTSIMRNIVYVAVVIVGGLTILNGVGVAIAPMLTALGVGGLAVALALQDTLANLFAGFYITIGRQIRVGHYLKLDSGEEGYLVDIGWRAARIRMLPNNLVLVPNAKLAQAIVTNCDLPDKEMAVLVDVGVDYDSDLRHVERVTIEVAREVLQTTPGGVETFDPFIRYHTFADSSVNFTVILRAREFVDQYLIKHEFVKQLHERYAHEGITIPFPIRTIVSRSSSDAASRAA
jgi:small-conductance mechanosensitive channel